MTRHPARTTNNEKNHARSKRRNVPVTTALTVHRVDLAGAVGSEWVKFQGLRSNVIVAGFAFVLIGANAILMPWAYVLRDRSTPQADYNPYPEMIVDKVGYIGILLAILGAMLVAGEYRSGQIKTTLLSVPKRTPVLVSKSLVAAAVSFTVGVPSAGIGFAAAPPILATGGYHYDLSVGDGLRLVLGSGLYLAALSLVGVALGVLIRNVVASVLATIALLLVVPVIPQVFSQFGAEITRFFPIQAGSLLLAQLGNGGLGPWGGYAVLAAWAAALLAAAAVTLKRRDA